MAGGGLVWLLWHSAVVLKHAVRQAMWLETAGQEVPADRDALRNEAPGFWYWGGLMAAYCLTKGCDSWCN